MLRFPLTERDCGGPEEWRGIVSDREIGCIGRLSAHFNAKRATDSDEE